MLRQIQTINKHILRMPHNIQAGWSNFFTQHLATRYTKLPNHPPSSWFPRFNLWHMGLSKNSVSQSHQIIIIFPTQKNGGMHPSRRIPSFYSLVEYWWNGWLTPPWYLHILDEIQFCVRNGWIPPKISQTIHHCPQNESFCWFIYYYNVGKTIINNPFGLGIYHLFMVIWGMVKLLFYPHCINISPLGGSPQSQVGKVNLFQ